MNKQNKTKQTPAFTCTENPPPLGEFCSNPRDGGMSNCTGYCDFFGANTGCYNFPGAAAEGFPVTKCVCNLGYICWDNLNKAACESSDDFGGGISPDRLIPETTNLTFLMATSAAQKNNYACVLKYV
jgi:hypothetical protein